MPYQKTDIRQFNAPVRHDLNIPESLVIIRIKLTSAIRQRPDFSVTAVAPHVIAHTALPVQFLPVKQLHLIAVFPLRGEQDHACDLLARIQKHRTIGILSYHGRCDLMYVTVMICTLLL